MANRSSQYLTFFLNEQLFGIPVTVVREINQIIPRANLPRTQDHLPGVYKLRDAVLPFVDLRSKFGFDETPDHKDNCVVIIEGQQGWIGARVDAIAAVIDLTPQQIQAIPAASSFGQEPRAVQGFGYHNEQVIVILDIVAILSPENLAEIDDLFSFMAGMSARAS